MRKIQIANGGYYHVYNRGVDKRDVFLDGQDYTKFYEHLYLFNDANYHNPGNEPFHNETLLAASSVLSDDQDPLVKVLSYCLMPNHFHLFLRQEQDEGVEKFLHKLGMGYTRYFNRKHDRTGSLFESTYKATAVERYGHFFHMPRYIHCNALDLSTLNWREGKIENWPEGQHLLDTYPWSSHGVYMNGEQSLPIIDLDEVRKIFPSPKDYVEFLREWASRTVPCDLVTSDVS